MAHDDQVMGPISWSITSGWAGGGGVETAPSGAVLRTRQLLLIRRLLKDIGHILIYYLSLQDAVVKGRILVYCLRPLKTVVKTHILIYYIIIYRRIGGLLNSNLPLVESVAPPSFARVTRPPRNCIRLPQPVPRPPCTAASPLPSRSLSLCFLLN